jgi:2-(1,2-epoxy-1,2-dihydrophenyl)acetyl-CoA isomerase
MARESRVYTDCCMKYNTLTLQVADGLARVELARPALRNRIDAEFCRDLRSLADELATRRDVRAVLVTAQGEYFSVGGDVDSFAADREQLQGLILDWTGELHLGLTRLMTMDPPIVVAVQGAVAGGAASLVAACDVVCLASSARISSAYPKIGLSADLGATFTFAARMGLARARRFLLLGETLDAQAALESGLADRICAAESLQSESEAVARQLASGPTRALGELRRLMLNVFARPLESQLEAEAQAQCRVGATEDAWRGIVAFREKRRPEFQGR